VTLIRVEHSFPSATHLFPVQPEQRHSRSCHSNADTAGSNGLIYDHKTGVRQLSSLLALHNRSPREVAMNKNTTPKADKTPQTSPEAPFTTFIQLDEKSPVPSQFRTPGTFTITRLQSPAGLPDRITKLSPVPALLVSISLKSLPSSSYQVGHQTSSFLHPSFTRFAPMSSISIHSQDAGQAAPSITFTILFLARDSMTSRRISVLAM